MTAPYEPKLLTLPGAAVSAEVALQRTLQKVGRIRAVAIVIQWDDLTFDCDWSSMKVSELCMASKIFDLNVANTVASGSDVT